MTVKAKVSYENKIKSTTHKTEKKLSREMHKHGKKILKIAKEKYVPVVTGNLKESGKVEKPDHSKNGTGGIDKISVEVVFGGADAEYAGIVHEAPPDWGQGKNKYLEKAVKEHEANIHQELVQEMMTWHPSTSIK